MYLACPTGFALVGSHIYTGLSVRNDLDSSSSSLEWTFIGLQLYRAHIFIYLLVWRGLKLYTSAQQSASKLPLYMCMDLHCMCIHNCKVLHNHSQRISCLRRWTYCSSVSFPHKVCVQLPPPSPPPHTPQLNVTKHA